MKKTTFYSLMRKDGKNQAVPHDGYTDGTYNYYKLGSNWAAIHPELGLAVCFGKTRKEAAATATAPGMVERVARKLEQSGDRMRETFEAALRETAA